MAQRNMANQTIFFQLMASTRVTSGGISAASLGPSGVGITGGFAGGCSGAGVATTGAGGGETDLGGVAGAGEGVSKGDTAAGVNNGSCCAFRSEGFAWKMTE